MQHIGLLWESSCFLMKNSFPFNNIAFLTSLKKSLFSFHFCTIFSNGKQPDTSTVTIFLNTVFFSDVFKDSPPNMVVSNTLIQKNAVYSKCVFRLHPLKDDTVTYVYVYNNPHLDSAFSSSYHHYHQWYLSKVLLSPQPRRCCFQHLSCFSFWTASTGHFEEGPCWNVESWTFTFLDWFIQLFWGGSQCLK